MLATESFLLLATAGICEDAAFARMACSLIKAAGHVTIQNGGLALLYRVGLDVDGKVFYRRCGKDSFQVHGNDFFLTRDKE